MKDYICQYCGKECKNLNSLRQHEIRCKENPDKIDMSYIKPGHSIGHKGSNQFIKAKELGLEKPIVSNETRQKIGNKSRGRKFSDKAKKQLSESMKQAVVKYPESYSASNINGRVKHYQYNGYTLDGTWEVEVAKYLDKNNIKWIRPNYGFEYEYNNDTHIYYPDFYLPDYDYYIEVKGYQRDKDPYKWKVINRLIIIKKKEIKEIKNNTYQIHLV